MEVWVIIFLCIELTLGKQCCPEGSWLVQHSRTCSDNVTEPDLKCVHSYLLDPHQDPGDKFIVDEGIEQLTLDGEIVPTKFCVSKIQRNDSLPVEDKVALVCFPNEPEPAVNQLILNVLMGISTVFMLLTLFVYLSIPSLRDLAGKCMIAFSSSLCLAYIILIVAQTRLMDTSDKACVFQALLMYFVTISAFFWLNAVTFNVWRSVTWRKNSLTDKTWFWIYFCWGYGVPLLLVFVTVLVDNLPGDHLRPRFGEVKCWFKGPEESWSFFYGPVAVLLVLNILMFISTLWKLWNNYRDASAPRIRSLRFKCILYLRLFLLMGIVWVFEVLSFALHGNTGLWFITDCLNSLQGVIIFLILVAFRKRARLGLARNKVCGIKWPKSWAETEDIESEVLSEEAEVELTQPK